MGFDCDEQDNQKYVSLKYRFEDYDMDGHWHDTEKVNEICTNDITTLIFGFSLTPPDTEESIGDCDDHEPNIYRSVNLFADIDQDGYGASDGEMTCIGDNLPQNTSLISSDCDDTNSQHYQRLPFDLIDTDGDGSYVQVEQKFVCTGAALGKDKAYLGYALEKEDQDCNDNDPEGFIYRDYYLDLDVDGFGSGPLQRICSENLVTGFARNNSDCDDLDQNKWNLVSFVYKDLDGDGFYKQYPFAEQICIGRYPPIGYTLETPSQFDCNDEPNTGNAVFLNRTLFKDIDKDGVGGLGNKPSVYCVGSKLPVGLSPYTGDANDHDPLIQQMVNDETLILHFN